MNLKKERITDSIAHKIACKQFRDIDPIDMGIRAKVIYKKYDKKFRIRFLNQEYMVSYPDAQLGYYREGNKEPDIYIQILILHYLAGSKNLPLTGKLISCRELPSGNTYYDAFFKNAVSPVAQVFGANSTLFKESANKLGGVEKGYGDMAFSIPVLPRIPLVYILWLADEELPASSTILFDSSTPSHLPTEDLTFLGEITTSRLINP